MERRTLRLRNPFSPFLFYFRVISRVSRAIFFSSFTGFEREAKAGAFAYGNLCIQWSNAATISSLDAWGLNSQTIGGSKGIDPIRAAKSIIPLNGT